MAEQESQGTPSDIVMGEPRTNANDFQMIGATTQDANKFEQSLLYLQGSPYATSITDAASGVNVTFDHSSLWADEAKPDGSGVVWNPEAALQLPNGDIMSPAVNLLSEFAHLELPGGLGDNVTPDPVWDSPAERIAHEGTNVAAGELGEPLRDGYYGVTPVQTGDPTYSYNSGGDLFDYDAFSAVYGVTSNGLDSGLGSSGYDSFGGNSGASNFGFDYGSFNDSYGIGNFSLDSFGGGGGSGDSGFSADNSLYDVAFV